MLDSPSLALAFAAGLASFVSPCCLPLVPGYLAAVCGQGPGVDRRVNLRVLARSLAFVSTFSLVFIVFGLTATALGSVLADNQPMLNKVAGALIICMGALFIASVFIVRLNRQWHIEMLLQRAGRGGPLVAGAGFAIAWTPCVGPTLGAILGLAATTSGTAQGALLLGVYSAGLALPFVGSALAYERAARSLAWFRRHYATMQVTSGVLLVAVGTLVYTGQLFRLNVEIQQLLDRLGLNFWQSI
jgi:cytochrome c-type biogenesis protein